MNRIAKSGRGKRWHEPIPHSDHNRGDSHSKAMAAVANLRRLRMIDAARCWLNIARDIRLGDVRLIVRT